MFPLAGGTPGPGTGVDSHRAVSEVSGRKAPRPVPSWNPPYFFTFMQHGTSGFIAITGLALARGPYLNPARYTTDVFRNIDTGRLTEIPR